MKNIIKSILTFLFMIVISTSFTVIAQGKGEGGGGGCNCPEGDAGCLQACYYESPDYQEKDTPEESCKGIKLNTNFPIIGNCIGDDSNENTTNAFPTMIGALTRIVITIILIVCFILIIYAGILWAGSGDNNSQATKAKGILMKVAVTILLLGFSGVILRLINPNFFG